MQMPQMGMGAANGTDSLPFAAGINGKMPAERLEMLIFPGITPQVFFGLHRKVLLGCGRGRMSCWIICEIDYICRS